MFAAHPTGRPSASAHSGSAGEKWAFLNLEACRSFSSPGRLKQASNPKGRSCYLIDPAHALHTHTHTPLYYPSCPLLPARSQVIAVTLERWWLALLTHMPIK